MILCNDAEGVSGQEIRDNPPEVRPAGKWTVVEATDEYMFIRKRIYIVGAVQYNRTGLW